MGAGVMRDCLPHSLPHNFACAVPKSTSSEGKVPSSTLETEELAAVAHRSTLGECKLQTIATMSQQDGGSVDQQNAIESRLSSELMEARETFKAAKRQFKTGAGQAHATGLYHADGAHALRSAAKEYIHARQQYRDVLRRLNDFILNGAIPPE
jgi:hypothetical protein